MRARNGGRWLLRIEDLDRPREVPGSGAAILATLEAFGFQWDGEVLRQREREGLYAGALEQPQPARPAVRVQLQPPGSRR